MTGAGVAIIFLAFGIGALLAAAIPGLTVGFLIGLYVERREYRFMACFAFNVIGTLIACVWWIRQTPVSPVTALVIFGALLIMTSIGAWLGRKLAAAAPNGQ